MPGECPDYATDDLNRDSRHETAAGKINMDGQDKENAEVGTLNDE
jgi:hypothetical protein